MARLTILQGFELLKQFMCRFEKTSSRSAKTHMLLIE